VRELAAAGVREITLLGQTVNAYGRHDLRRGKAAAVGTESFAALLRRLAGEPGIERIRYTSPHPSFFDDDLVRAHGQLAPLCPHVHLPAQSGSDAVLERMRRPYTAAHYRALCDRLRAARPDVALTTDLIVGFPGETDADFRATLALVRDVAFVDAYTFKYSPRPNTTAEAFADAVDPAVAQARLEELQDVQRSLTLAAHRAARRQRDRGARRGREPVRGPGVGPRSVPPRGKSRSQSGKPVTSCAFDWSRRPRIR